MIVLTKVRLQPVIKGAYSEIQAMIFLRCSLIVLRFFLIFPHRKASLVLGKGLLLEESVRFRLALHLWFILLIIKY
jgi:hypothetical protein